MDGKYSLPSNSELLMSMFVLASLDLLQHSTALLTPRDDSTSAHAHTFVHKRMKNCGRFRTAKQETAECKLRSGNRGVRTANRERETRSTNDGEVRSAKTQTAKPRTVNEKHGLYESW